MEGELSTSLRSCYYQDFPFRSELEGGISGRHLQCGYMDWDEIRSTIRVTRKKLGLPL